MTNATGVGNCVECDTPLTRKGGGPKPTYCSASCRAKASARRAKADGREKQWAANAAAKRAAEREANARECPYCGDLMTYSRRVQCGKPECKRLWTNERMKAYQQKHKAKHGVAYSQTFTYERICESCGNTWTTRLRDARFCSISCINKARQYSRTCASCAGTWTSNLKQQPVCSSCSKQQRLDAKLEQQRLSWLPAINDWPHGPAWCKIPDEHPARLYRPSPRLFVQGECRRCDTPFCVQSEAGIASYCSLKCQRRDTKDRRRALKKKAFVANVSRARIFDRDKWTCKLCDEPVKRNALVPHPLAPVIDHIVPLARGGTHEPSNTQCAHFQCNSVKGARGGGEQLMLRG